jgi:CRP-like cAMP-binding protein
VTAAARCELLELDHATLEEVSSTHPGIRDVLRRVADERKDSSRESKARGGRVAKTTAGPRPPSRHR